MEHTFDTPSTVLFGAGARFRLPEELNQLGVRRVLLVTDGYLVKTGLIDTFETQLRNEGIESTVFADVQPDPTDSNVIAGLEVLRAFGGRSGRSRRRWQRNRCRQDHCDRSAKSRPALGVSGLPPDTETRHSFGRHSHDCWNGQRSDESGCYH